MQTKIGSAAINYLYYYSVHPQPFPKGDTRSFTV